MAVKFRQCEIISNDANLITISIFFNGGKYNITQKLFTVGWLLPILHALPFIKNSRIGDAKFQEVVKIAFQYFLV